MARFRELPVASLRVGHFIVLPPPWHRHPFLRSRFLLKDPRDLERLLTSGISHVMVDAVRSQAPLPDLRPDTRHMHRKEEVEPPSNWNQDQLVSPAFREMIRNTRLPAPVKARAVHRASIDQMKRLMQDPTTDRLAEYKSGLTELVDAVMADDALSASLLHITTHDFYTWTHSVNVGTLSLLFARSLYKGSDSHDLHEIAAAFFLHDIGKVRIDSALLNKRGRFDDAERREMDTHVNHGLDLLRETGTLKPEALVIVAQHHERVDGSGYPNACSAADILETSTICAFADVFDALTSVRPYKTGVSPFDALRIIRRDMVSAQNQQLFDQFVLLFDA